FLIFLMCFNLFWGAGYFVYSGLLDIGDWALFARDMLPSGSWWWRPVAVCLGLALYLAGLRGMETAFSALPLASAGSPGGRRRLVILPYG
ncbi:hypothetical protein, partial [Enterobacter hormaechei]|uniref:hypothetical protein n=1 Tax=Enterobacter hormaechei TaxID=158836 RepID=UPI00195385EF